MIKGIGIDMVDLNVLKDSIDENFINYILSPEEKKLFENIPVEETKLSFIGGRFSAKEALFKALKKDRNTNLYKEFSIIDDETGAPTVISELLKSDELIHISITHTNNYALAYVVVENTK